MSKSARSALLEIIGDRDDRKQLQVAAVVSDPRTAEVKAIVGGRDNDIGFNRALNAKRQVGSLIKPFIYAEALARESDYHLVTPLEDREVSLTDPSGEVWSPKNYDGQLHGSVYLLDAFSKSYNLATVHLGLELGVPAVIDRISAMGFDRKIGRYPAVLLGAVDMSPVEVAQLYQGFANEGFLMPLRAIRGVLDVSGNLLEETRTEVKRVMSGSTAFLSEYLLQNVVRYGTGRRIGAHFGQNIVLAGKTGTSDETRDAWFAGFGEDYLGVVWVGRDDNGRTGLTGSSAAVPIWIAVMDALGIRGTQRSAPEDITHVWFDAKAQVVHADACEGDIRLPIVSSHDIQALPCGTNSSGGSSSLWQRFRQLW